MTKPNLSVLLFSSLLYPIAWYLLYPQEAFGLMFGYVPMGVVATAATAAAALSGLLIIKAILGQSQGLLAGVAVRIGGAVIAGFLSPFMISIVMNIIAGGGVWFDMAWWELLWTPAFAAAFGAYWLTNLLVKFVTPV